MKRYDRTMFSLAVVISLLLHGAIAWGVMDLRLTATPRSSLFQSSQREVDSVAVSVRRAGEDLIVRDEGEAAAPVEPELEDDPAALREQAERLLENLDLSDLFEAEDTPAEADEEAEREFAIDEPAHVDTAVPLPSPAAMVDISAELLAMAEPSVTLPQFVASTDDLTPPVEDAPMTESDAPVGDDDFAALDDLFSDDLFSDDLDGGPAGEAVADDDAGFDPLAALGPDGDDFGPPGGAGGRGAGGGSRSDAGRDGGGDPFALAPAAVGPDAVGGRQFVGGPDLTRTLIEAPTLRPGVEAAASLHLDGDFTYDLRVAHDYSRPRGVFDLLGVTEPEEEESWFEVRIGPRESLRRLEPLNKDVVWAIDTSASVSQWYVNQAGQGVRRALGTLNEGDRFNIVLFSDGARKLSADGLLEATDENVERARQFLSRLSAGGRSDVHAALSDLLVRSVPSDRVYQIILLSDGVATGGSVSARNMVNLISRANDRVASIHAVGIGADPDRKLLDLLAYRNKGSARYPENAAATAATIADLATRLRYPVLRDATFSAVGVDARQIHPQTPRDIYLGEPLSLFGRFTDATRRLSMQIGGTNRDQDLDLTFTLDFRRARPGADNLPRDWAFWRLHDLYREVLREGESADLNRQLDFLRRRYNLTAY